MVPSWADQLLLQLLMLLMEHFDTLPIQCRHIEHMHEGNWFRKNIFWQNDSCENLENVSLIRLSYMHRWCLHGSIKSYFSFWWNNLILCWYNVDTLNICMKENGSQKITLTKWQLWELRQLFPYMAFVYAWIVPLWAYQLLPSFWWINLILCRYNVDTLNICMKEFIIFVCSDSSEIFSKLRSAGLNYNLSSFFSLTLTVRGYLISIAYCLFSFSIFCFCIAHNILNHSSAVIFMYRL